MLATYLFCLYVSIASAMGNWCAQFAPAIYCVIRETTSGVSGTAIERRENNLSDFLRLWPALSSICSAKQLMVPSQLHLNCIFQRKLCSLPQSTVNLCDQKQTSYKSTKVNTLGRHTRYTDICTQHYWLKNYGYFIFVKMLLFGNVYLPSTALHSMQLLIACSQINKGCSIQPAKEQIWLSSWISIASDVFLNPGTKMKPVLTFAFSSAARN